MATNYFDLSKEYVNLLRKEGQDERAADLENVILGAATSNELIMGVRFTLKKVALDDLSEIGKKKVQSYLTQLEKLLGPYPSR